MIGFGLLLFYIIMLELITSLLKLVTPDPNMKDIRLERKTLKLEKKKLRIAERMYKDIEREFKKGGLTDDETQQLDSLKGKILERKMQLIIM